MNREEAIRVLKCTSLQVFCLCKVAIDGKVLSMKEALVMAIEALENQKTGHWIEKEDYDGDTYYDCSECGESFCLLEGTPIDNLYNYCPNCGAKMEGK